MDDTTDTPPDGEDSDADLARNVILNHALGDRPDPGALDPVVEAMDLVAHAAHSADPLAVIQATETAIGYLHAAQLKAMNRLAVQMPAVEDVRGDWVDPAPAEVAAAQSWSHGAASARFALAEELAGDLPQVLAALQAGRIDLPRAQQIADGTRWVHPLIRPGLAAEAIGYATGHTRAQLRAWLGRRVAVLDPDAAERRHQRRRKTDRGCGPPRTGTGWPP